MINRWDDLNIRAFSSNLLGRDDALVLHGGGNTSVKIKENGEEILYVKGSGWDLADIKPQGFAPVKMKALLDLAQMEHLSDGDMVSAQRAAMTDQSAPNPSVEAILHALIPYKFVDHTHADAIVTLSNSERGEELIAQLFPDFLIVPYVMPGFILAHTIYEMTRDFDWGACGGIILHHHGIFTFDDDAQKSYDAMIRAVSLAEDFLDTHAKVDLKPLTKQRDFDTTQLQNAISQAKGYGVVLHVNTSALAQMYASQDKLKEFSCQGVLTPEHIIRTKRVPLVIENDDIKQALEAYQKEYVAYFEQFAQDEICLNPAPNYAVIKDFGMICFGKDAKEASIINDIVEHTMLAVLRAQKLGGYKSITIEESFRMEYWELEQAKLRR